jgi:fatty-acyl-CoA synthase
MEVPLLATDFLNRAVKLFPSKEAIVDGDARFTYAEFGARINQLAHALTGLGVGKGDRVSIISPNSHQFLETYYATSVIGAVIVPVNYRLIAADFEYINNHSGARVCIVDSDYTDTVDSIRDQCPTVEHYLSVPYEGATTPNGWTDFESLIAGQPTSPPADPGLGENDLLSINYTSGTTARPKGVMITHRNVYINTYNFIIHLKITQDDREMWTLPMFHANGWGGPFAITAMGATHVVLRAVSGKGIFDLIEHEKITFACMAPAVLATILEYPDKDQHTVTTRPRFTIAGAPPPQAFVRRLEEELGWEFNQIYGLTETSPILTVNEIKTHLDIEGDDYYRIKARAGHDVIGTDIAVFGTNGDAVPWDDESVGEVAARSNVVLKGYWQQPEEDAKVLRDGYFYTGDLATVNKDGYINIVDRAKDVIISGGENISSLEIEDVLYKHDDVLEAAVIGVPSEKWGETPIAIIVPREGTSPTQEAIIAHCRENMAHFKAPSKVEFVQALPRTATGKLKKFELRDEFWEGQTKRVN